MSSDDLIKKGRRSGIASLVNQMTRPANSRSVRKKERTKVPEVINKEIAFSDSNRVGSFNVLYEFLSANREMMGALFALCVIIEVENHESGRGKVYYAASNLFDPLKEGAEIMQYRIEAAKRDEGFPDPEHEARRINSGNFGFVAIRQTIIRVPTVKIGMKLNEVN